METMRQKAAIRVREIADAPLDFQLDRLARHCRRRRWEVVGVYGDVTDAVPERKRSGTAHALKDAFDGEFKIIVVWRLGALATNANGLIHALRFAVAHGIRIVSVGDGVDTGRGRTMANLVKALAACDSATNTRLGVIRPRDPCEGCPMAASA